MGVPRIISPPAPLSSSSAGSNTGSCTWGKPAARAADILAGLVSDTERERARERASNLLVALAAAWDSIERDRAESVTAASLGPLLAWIGCDRRTYEDAVSAALDLFGHAA